MPCAEARRLASGLALTRSPEAGAAAGAAGGAAGAGAAGAGAGAAGPAAGEGAAAGAGAAPASAFVSVCAGGAAGLAAGADAASSSPAISAITAPTCTPSVPSGTRISITVPSSTASNSIVALSVSISARRSPDFTTSPTLTSHLASVPSSIVGERAGILSSIGISASYEEFGHGFDDGIGVEAVGSVEVGEVAGLAEAVDAERAGAHAAHAAEP